jgi:tight adherence protein B
VTRRFAAVLAALAAGLMLAGPASAAPAPLRIVRADNSHYPRVVLTLSGLPAGVSSVSVSQNGGQPVQAVPDLSHLGEAIVLAIDTSNSMAGSSLRNVSAAAKQFLNLQGANTDLGVIAFNSTPSVAAPISAGSTAADQAVDNLAAGGNKPGTAIYGAVVQAAQALAHTSVDQRVIVLFTDGFSVNDTSTLQKAIAAARAAHVQIFTVGTSSSPKATGPLSQLATATGGRFVPAADSTKVAAAFKSISQSLGNVNVFDFTSAVPRGESYSITVSTATGQTVTQTLQAPGSLATSGGGSGGLPLPTGTAGSALVAGVAALLVMVIALVLLSSRRNQTVSRRIAPHVEQKTAVAVAAAAEIPNMSILHQLFVATEKVAGSLKYWQKLSFRLEQASLPLRTAEVVYMQLGAALLLGVAGAGLLHNGLIGLILLPVGAALPLLYVRFKATRRMKQFEGQLPETLITMAASLKAGHAFNSALNSVVKEGAPPTSIELARVASEIQLGMSSEEALEAMAGRMGSANFGFVVMAVNIQRTVGGSLADILDMVADTVRQRQQFHKKVKALTAQGRMSAYVLLAMPFLMALGIYAIRGSYMNILFTSSIGQVLIGAALVNMAIGAVILRKIVSFKG